MTMPVTPATMTDGRGSSCSPAPAVPTGRRTPPMAGFADNSGWTDDTWDGPVAATVRTAANLRG